MLRKSFFICLLCSVACLPLWVHSQQVSVPPSSINYGRVYNAPLSHFASDPTLTPYQLLLDARPDAAAPLLKKALQQNKSDVALFVAYVQSSPDQWKREIEHWTEEFSFSPNDATAKFRLGTLLYYQVGGQRATALTESNIEANMKVLQRARTLLEKAWNQQKTPLFGMMLAEVTYSEKHDLKIVTSLLKQIMRLLVSPTGYQHYLQAERSGWRTKPPSINDVKPTNRQALRGVLKSLWSDASAEFSYTVQRNGKTEWVKAHVPQDQVRRKAYFDLWLKDLKNASVASRN